MWNLDDLAPDVTVEAQTVAQVKTLGDASENSLLEVASLTVSAKRRVWQTRILTQLTLSQSQAPESVRGAG